MSIPLLVVQNLTKHFSFNGQHNLIFNKISVIFNARESYAITGISGTGKSTLLHLLAGFDVPNEGSIFFENKNYIHFSQIEKENYRNCQIGMMFQQPHLVRELSVLENVMMPGSIGGMGRAECIERGHNLLVAVGIGEKAHHMPASLSGGQQQRAALARALFNRPRLLLADEPTGNLDAATGEVIIQLLKEQQRETGTTLIVGTHDMRMAQAMQHELRVSHNTLEHVRSAGSIMQKEISNVF